MVASYFHFSEEQFGPGDVLTPPSERGLRSVWDGHHGGRSNVVYLFDGQALRLMDFDPPWASHLYEVEALGPVAPDPERETSPNPVADHSWVAPRARVLREVPEGEAGSRR